MNESFLLDDATVESLFKVAGFKVDKVFELANKYWPKVPDYAELRMNQPWWLVDTNHGKIIVGPRKRVFVIDWFHTKFRGLVTEPNESVTSDRTTVHAWDSAEFMKFLTRLATKMAAENKS